MKGLDDELRHALGREEPPAGFAERVRRRVAEGQPQRHQRPRRRSFIGWAAAAALVAAVAGVVQYHTIQKSREERARGEAAKEQVVHALRIAGSKLQLVQVKIKGIGS